MPDAIRNIVIRTSLEIDTTSLASLDTAIAESSLKDFEQRAAQTVERIADRSQAVTGSLVNKEAVKTVDNLNRSSDELVRTTEKVFVSLETVTKAAAKEAEEQKKLAVALREVTAARDAALDAQNRADLVLVAKRTPATSGDEAIARAQARGRVFTELGQRKFLAEQNFGRQREFDLARLKFENEREPNPFITRQDPRPAILDRLRKETEEAFKEVILKDRDSTRGLTGPIRSKPIDPNLFSGETFGTSQNVDLSDRTFDKLGRTLEGFNKTAQKSRLVVGQLRTSLISGAAAATQFAVAADESQSVLTRIAASTGGVLSAGLSISSLASSFGGLKAVLPAVLRLLPAVGIVTAAVAPLVFLLAKAKREENESFQEGLRLDRIIDGNNAQRIEGLKIRVELTKSLLEIAKSRRGLDSERASQRQGTENSIIGDLPDVRERIAQRGRLLDDNFDALELIKNRDLPRIATQQGINRANGVADSPALLDRLRDALERQSRLVEDQLALQRDQARDETSNDRNEFNAASTVFDLFQRGRDTLNQPGSRGAVGRGDINATGLTPSQQQQLADAVKNLPAGVSPGDIDQNFLDQLGKQDEAEQASDRETVAELKRLRDELNNTLRDVTDSQAEVVAQVKANAELQKNANKETIDILVNQSQDLETFKADLAKLKTVATSARQSGGGSAP